MGAVASKREVAAGKDTKITPAVIAVASNAGMAASSFRMVFMVRTSGVAETMRPDVSGSRARASRTTYLSVFAYFRGDGSPQTMSTRCPRTVQGTVIRTDSATHPIQEAHAPAR